MPPTFATRFSEAQPGIVNAAVLRLLGFDHRHRPLLVLGSLLGLNEMMLLLVGPDVYNRRGLKRNVRTEEVSGVADYISHHLGIIGEGPGKCPAPGLFIAPARWAGTNWPGTLAHPHRLLACTKFDPDGHTKTVRQARLAGSTYPS